MASLQNSFFFSNSLLYPMPLPLSTVSPIIPSPSFSLLQISIAVELKKERGCLKSLLTPRQPAKLRL